VSAGADPTAAERQRRRRTRRAAGRVVEPIEFDLWAVSDALGEAGRLPCWDGEDRKAIRRAIEVLLEDLCAYVTRDALK
jgi:hypothetical protein